MEKYMGCINQLLANLIIYIIMLTFIRLMDMIKTDMMQDILRRHGLGNGLVQDVGITDGFIQPPKKHIHLVMVLQTQTWLYIFTMQRSSIRWLSMTMIVHLSAHSRWRWTKTSTAELLTIFRKLQWREQHGRAGLQILNIKTSILIPNPPKCLPVSFSTAVSSSRHGQ